MGKNSLETEFKFDSKDSFKKIDLLESKLTALDKKLNALGGSLNFGGNLQTQLTNAVSPLDKMLQRAQSDIARYQKQTLDGEKAITKSVEREAKLQADSKIREQKRAANELIRSIGEVANAEKISNAGKSLNAGREILSGIGLPLTIGAGVGIGIAALERSIQKSFELEKANRLLSASATEAGLSYQFLAQNNEKFAKSAGLSETAAGSLTARIAQLATGAGRPQDIEKLQKSFLDLGSARGIGTQDLENLVGTILSGQDEGLNRLGISDPSKLQAKYAESLGKTADALTQTEKTQAAVNAVMEKAAIFTGANEDRLKSLSGQAETAKSNLDNLTTSFGAGITNTLEFRDAISLTNDILGSFSTNVSDIRKQLAQGLTPKQIAEKEADGLGNRTLDFLKDQSLALPKVGLFAYDLLTEGFQTASDRFVDAVSGAKQRRIDALTGLIEGEQKLIQKQNQAAIQQAEALRRKLFEEQVKSEQEQQKKLQTENLRKYQSRLQSNDLEGKGLSVPELRAFQKEVLSVGSGLAIEDRLKLAEDAAKKIKQATDAAKNSVRETLFGQSFDNPLVKPILEFETATDRAKEKFGKFGDEVVNKIAAIEKANLTKAINLQSFNSSFEGLKYEQNARRLQMMPETEFASFGRAVDKFEKSVNFIVADNSLSRKISEADYYARLYNPNNPKSFAEFNKRNFNDDVSETGLQIRNALEDIQSIKKISLDGTGVYGQGFAANAVVGIIPRLDELVKRLDSPDAGTREDARKLIGLYNEALPQIRAASRQKFADEIQRLNNQEFSRTFGVEQLDFINNRRGLSDKDKLFRRLDVYNSLGNDLDPRLRQEAIRDNLRAASVKRDEAREALELARKTLAENVKLTEMIKGLLTDKGLKVDAGEKQVDVGVIIKNASDTSVKALERANEQDAAEGFSFG